MEFDSREEQNCCFITIAFSPGMRHVKSHIQIPGVEALCRVVCAAAPNACGSSVWKSLQVTPLASRILRCLLHFWKLCAYRMFSGGYSAMELICCLKYHSWKSNLLLPTDTQFYERQKKIDRPFTDEHVHIRTISLIGCGASGAYATGPDEEHVHMLRFYENLMSNIFFVDTTFWQKVCL